MKALVYTAYGSPDVLQLKEVKKPTPLDNQVLIRVHAASLNALDFRRFEQLSAIGRFMEERLIQSVGKVLGADIAGVVESVGKNVRRFHPGDEVFGVAAGNLGGFAQYACAREDQMVYKPRSLSFDEAAAVPVAATAAYQALRKVGPIAQGSHVLLYGASGGVGTFALQMAKAYGAVVTAVCSTTHVKIARSLGVDICIDYTKEHTLSYPKQYDRIVVINGARPVIDYWRVLLKGGSCVVVGGAMSQILQSMIFGPFLSAIGQKKLAFLGIAKENATDLEHITTMIESGKVKPVIDKIFQLHQAQEAIRYVLEGHAAGKVVLKIM